MRQQRESWPSWRHGPSGESAIFQSEAEVPIGWSKKPGLAFIPVDSVVLDREALVEKLTDLGIEINPIWGTAHLKRMLDDYCPPR